MQVSYQFNLLFGIARARGNDGAAQRTRPTIEDEASGCQVIRKGVQHQIGRAESGRMQSASRMPVGEAQTPE